MTEENGRTDRLKNNLIFLTVPINTLVTQLKFGDIYKTAQMVFLMTAVCVLCVLVEKLGKPEEKAVTRGFFAQLGFIIVSLSALFMDVRYVNWLFFCGILITAIFSDILFSITSVCVYIPLIIVFSEPTPKYAVMNFLLAIAVIVMAKYFSDFKSLIYVIITVISFNTALHAILQGFKLKDFIERGNIIDILSIVAVMIFSWTVFKITEKSKIANKASADVCKEEGAGLEAVNVEETYTEDVCALKIYESENSKDAEVTVLTDTSGKISEADESREDEAEFENLVNQENMTELEEEVKYVKTINEIEKTEEAEKTEQTVLNQEETVEPTEEIEKEKNEDSAETNEGVADNESVSELTDLTDDKFSEENTENTAEEIDYKSFISEDNELYQIIKENDDLYNNFLLISMVSEEMAEAIGANEALAATGGFYCECGRIISNNYIKEGLKLAKKFELPERVADCIKEHHFKAGKPKSKETAIIMIADKLSATINFLKTQNKRMTAEHIIDGVTDSCLMSGKLDGAGLSTEEYRKIKDCLIKEAVGFYDYFDRE